MFFRRAYLVEIGLQEMNLLALFQKSWPVLLLLILLPKYKLYIPRGMIRLAVLDIDLSEKF